MKFTNHSGQARIFAKRETAMKWRKKCKNCGAAVLKIGYLGFVVHTDKGWLK